MIYCNLTDKAVKMGVKINGNGLHIRDELAAILTEINKTPRGISLFLDALEQSEDPEWMKLYESETQAFSDPNRRNKA